MEKLINQFLKDQLTWDECAETYERQIVSGHPDITAFEEFEEDFLDSVLRFLCKSQDRRIKVMDIGCGSGRLHIRYGAKTLDVSKLPSSHPLLKLKALRPDLAYDRILRQGLDEVWGIDFSSKMIRLAEDKVNEAQLRRADSVSLNLVQGSAFDLTHEPEQTLPIAVSLVNSVGVTQGPLGAIELFKSMRRAVEPANGIAIISCYQQEYLESYGLGQYESTLDVSGQPWWMTPDTYATKRYRKVPKQYKRAHDQIPELIVDVYDSKGKLVEEGFCLTRDPKRTNQTLKTGHIRTHSNYESNWYSFELIDEWIAAHWTDKSYHIQTKQVDAIRAEPAQMAILDCGNHLEALFRRWEVID
jgi:SAM-dependent methyltransferase